MESTLAQLGELLLGAIPTAVLLVILVFFYNGLVHKPLSRVLAQRREHTEGAVAKARADIAAAEARTAEYEQRLREARQVVFKRQEARRKEALELKAKAVGEAREQAVQHVRQARAEIEKETTAASADLQREAERLAQEIVQTVLRTPTPSPAGGVR